MHDILTLLAQRKHLTKMQATRGFQVIMNGGATPAQMAAFLMGLRCKGETVEEITAGSLALRAKAAPFPHVDGAIDTCGTGGDGKRSYNVSTATALALAACGLPVIKHGNRSVSSLTGSADVLQALGVNIDAERPVLEKCLAQCGICFLFAPRFHSATRHVAPVRQELGFRTIFNLLGPLSNPAAPTFQLLGVYDGDWVEKIAYVLKELGVQAAWVVHGSDGSDELCLSGATQVAELKNGEIYCFEVTPEDAGLTRISGDALTGNDPEHNAQALLHAISGMKGAFRDAIIYNAAAGLLIAGKAADLKKGATLAAHAIDSGNVHATLMRLIEVSNHK